VQKHSYAEQSVATTSYMDLVITGSTRKIKHNFSL